jgi:hypothetical protein
MSLSIRPVQILTAAGIVASIVASVLVYLAPLFKLTPPVSFGAPLRDGNRVYMLTGQWKSIYDYTDNSSRVFTSTDLLVDVWAFDALTAKPVYRRRLQKVDHGAMQGRKILGLQNKTLWVLLPAGLHAIDKETGAFAADPDSLQRLNPELRGLLPIEAQFYSFTDRGLTVKAADAKVWHIHPDTFLVSTEPIPSLGKAIMPPYITPQATYAFLERGFDIGTKWLGLLNPEEAATFGKNHAIRGLDYQSRRSLYAADISKATTFFGPQNRYSNFKALTEEFLAPGILSDHRPTGHHALIYRRDPDSLFVLHSDRLGEDGRLQLTRVAGPGGKVLWNTPLRLSVLQCLMLDEQSLVLSGVVYRRQVPNARVKTDPMHTATALLLSVNWATGAVSAFDHGDVDNHPEATPLQ